MRIGCFTTVVLMAGGILSHVTACIMTDDFGPHVREVVFGTDVPYETQIAELTVRLEARGWATFSYEAGTQRRVVLIARIAGRRHERLVP